MFISDNKLPPVFVDSDNNFIVNEIPWNSDKQSDDRLYQQIIFKLLRKPKKLISHLQRIHFVYELGMQDQLYAALVDLLWVLNGNGSALGRRMILSARSLLTEQQVEELKHYLTIENRALFLGNRFSVCTNGAISSREILFKTSEKVSEEYDPLMLARDYIEYSQLDEALETLEAAVLNFPERHDLQIELLELLRLTKNTQVYSKISDVFLERQLELTAEWQQLADYFAGISNEK